MSSTRQQHNSKGSSWRISSITWVVGLVAVLSCVALNWMYDPRSTFYRGWPLWFEVFLGPAAGIKYRPWALALNVGASACILAGACAATEQYVYVTKMSFKHCCALITWVAGNCAMLKGRLIYKDDLLQWAVWEFATCGVYVVTLLAWLAVFNTLTPLHCALVRRFKSRQPLTPID